jgi:hypothetical protein
MSRPACIVQHSFRVERQANITDVNLKTFYLNIALQAAKKIEKPLDLL